MSLEALPDWLHPLWQSLYTRRARLPHALLFCGAPGSGKRLFAEHLARALLCSQPDAAGFACGKCADCAWIEAGNHPDFFTVVPAADEQADAEAESEGEGGKKEKARSTQILIDQVRSLQSSLEVGAGGHAGGRRVVILQPAEAMNVAAANALLKVLEEPLSGTCFLMLSDAPRRLLPTIRSRCQVLDMPRPEEGAALAWLAARGVKDEALLGFASGLPLAALDFSSGPLADARARLAADLGAQPGRDPLKLAAEWESRLKAKGALEAGLAMPLLLAWLLRWVSDGARVANGLPARFFADQQGALARHAAGKGEIWVKAYRYLLEQRAVAAHPLNARLFLEEIFLHLGRLQAR